MITVFEVILTSGDRAEADTPEAAVLATRTLLSEATALVRPGKPVTASIYGPGGLVAAGLNLTDLKEAA